MMMEIINLLHPAIIDKHNTNQRMRGNSFVRVSKKDVYFSTAACKEYKLKLGQFIHFIKSREDWTFFMNDEDTGFLLTKKNENSLRITNIHLCKMIRGQETKTICFSLDFTDDHYFEKRIIKMIPI